MIGIGMYIVFGEYGSLKEKWRIETRIEVKNLEKGGTIQERLS